MSEAPSIIPAVNKSIEVTDRNVRFDDDRLWHLVCLYAHVTDTTPQIAVREIVRQSLEGA